MSRRIVKSIIVHKHDTTENWSKATNFIPLKGELIIYDDKHLKIGNGTQNVNAIPFITDVDSTALNSMIEEVLV